MSLKAPIEHPPMIFEVWKPSVTSELFVRFGLNLGDYQINWPDAYLFCKGLIEPIIAEMEKKFGLKRIDKVTK